MSTLEHFMIGIGEIGKNKGKLVLQNLEFLSEYNGKTWDDLHRDIKRRINGNQVTINLIGKGTPDEVKYTIFSRINQGDVPLKAQEIRTALFQGYRVDFLENLISADTESGRVFRKVTDGSVKSRRQEDLDFISRFVAFYINSYNQYEPDMDRFITIGTKAIPVNIDQQQHIQQDFIRSMELAYGLFGTDAFRKRLNLADPRKPINKPLFEIISVHFAKLDSAERHKILGNRETFIEAFIGLQRNNSRFWNSITNGTATKESVLIRNREFANLLNEFLND